MSTLVDDLLGAHALHLVDAARARGDYEDVWGALPLLRSADILAVGALADRIRAREIGDDVRLFVDGPPRAEAIVCASAPGLELLREVAIARITGPRGAHVRLDWNEVGLEIAMVALGFGADELTGRLRPPRTKKGLPVANGAQLRRDELARLVACSQRRPVFVNEEEDVRADLA
jgi:hypothetical protein